MFAGPLRSKLQQSIIITAFWALLWWGLSWFFVTNSAAPQDYSDHILYALFFSGVHSAWLIKLLNLLFIVVGALMLNYLSVQQEISGKVNFVPGFIYVMMGFLATDNSLLHPLLVANVVVLYSLNRFYTSYREEHRATAILFEAAFFMGLAPFFYTNYLILFPLCIIAVLILRPFGWRDWTAILMGYFTPFYIYACLMYLNDGDMFLMFRFFADSLTSFGRPVVSEYYYLFNLGVLLCLLMAMVHYLSQGLGPKVKTQKGKSVMIWFLIISAFNIFITEDASDFLFINCIIPLSLLIGDYMAEVKRLKIANTLLFLLLVGFALVYLHRLNIM